MLASAGERFSTEKGNKDTLADTQGLFFDKLDSETTPVSVLKDKRTINEDFVAVLSFCVKPT